MNLRRRSRSSAFSALLVPAIALATIGMLAIDRGARADDAPATKPADAPKPETPEAKPAQPDAKPEAKPDAKPEAPKAPDAKPAETPAERPSLRGTMYDGIYFNDLNGKPVELSDAVGKPMIIELWATWCGPCRQQREKMHELSVKYPEVVFVGASLDEKGPGAVRIYNAEHKPLAGSKVRDVMGTPQLRAKVATIDKSNFIPKMAFVNKKGQLIEVTGSQDPKFTEAMIKNLLK